MNHESYESDAVDTLNHESIILEGDEVEVMADHHLCLEGFLKANRGEALQVLVGSSVERGKIFCRKATGEAGWLRRAYVSPPQRRVGDLLLVGKSGNSETLPPETSFSSFSFASGDILELLTEGKDQRLWCRNLDGRCGWISLENFSKKLSELEATSWKKRVSFPLQLPQLAHRKVETTTELLPFPSMGRKPPWQSYEIFVFEGEVAEILEQSDAFTKVMMFSRDPQVIGWVPTKCLSSQPVQMQPMQATQPIPQQLPPLQRHGLQTIPETGDSSDVRRSERVISEAVHLEGRCSLVTPVSQQQWMGTTREAEPEPQSERGVSWIEAAEASLRTPSASQGNLAPDAQGRVIHVSSFGLETLDRELTWQCNHLGGGARCTVPEKDIAAALRRVQGGGAEAENLLILDARPFPDPNSWVLSQLGHSGRHHQIVGSLCHHRNFWYWLRDVKGSFQKQLEKSGDISVAIYCKRGKHRSVAAAVILRHIFQSEGYQCPKVWHMSYKQWTYCCYLDCDVCCNPPEEMQTHLDMALEYWRKI